jgi:hypothetical protein
MDRGEGPQPGKGGAVGSQFRRRNPGTLIVLRAWATRGSSMTRGALAALELCWGSTQATIGMN